MAKSQYLLWPSLGSKHILNYFGETVPKFSEVIFWYIIPEKETEKAGTGKFTNIVFLYVKVKSW